MFNPTMNTRPDKKKEERKWISVPSDVDGPLAKLLRQYHAEIRAGKAALIIAIAFKYRDESSGNRLRVTEHCFVLSASPFTPRECGRNRTFLE